MRGSGGRARMNPFNPVAVVSLAAAFHQNHFLFLNHHRVSAVAPIVMPIAT